MSHQRCCCDGTIDPPTDGSVPCIEVEFSIPTRSCMFEDNPSADPACADHEGVPYTRYTPGGMGTINQVFRIPATSLPSPNTRPYGTYQYLLDVPILVVHNQYAIDWGAESYQSNPTLWECVNFFNDFKHIYHTMRIVVAVDYQSDEPAAVASVLIDVFGTVINDFTKVYGASGRDTETSRSIGPLNYRLFNSGNIFPHPFNVPVDNENLFIGCDGKDGIFAEGTAIVRASSDTDCNTFSYVYKAKVCGGPYQGVQDEILVDIEDRPTGTNINPWLGNYAYKLTDERVSGASPTAGVIWKEEGCYPAAVQCGTMNVVPYDEAVRVSGSNTGYYFGLQFVPMPGEFTQGTPLDLDWSTDLCPGAAPAPLRSSQSTNTPTASANVLKKKGMISEAELDAMGNSPDQQRTILKQGGCCDPPRKN